METMTSDRRGFLKASAGALAALCAPGLTAVAQESANPLAPRKPHFTPTARRVIFLNMSGGPSAQETFNPKPKISKFPFTKHGASGAAVSTLFPHLSRHVDKLCMLHGMHCDSPDHITASIQLHCGKHLSSRPSMGAWLAYGLGSENPNLPGFIILNPKAGFAGSKVYSNAFIPAIYAGTPIANSLELADSRNPRMDRAALRALLDRTQARNRTLLKEHPQDAPLNGLVNSSELAFRMQSELPELLDVAKESPRVLKRYGIREGAPTDDFGRQCLAARRMSEAGVRFVELTNGNWDHHSAIQSLLPRQARTIDQPIGALLEDLAERDLLKDTLVLWGGEFGRLKTEEKKNGGSGHNNKGYTLWMAGGGVKAGFAYGDTDEEGLEAVEGRIHVHDLHATMLHMLGLDHEKLTYRFAGRDFRLTDTKGKVKKAILA